MCNALWARLHKTILFFVAFDLYLLILQLAKFLTHTHSHTHEGFDQKEKAAIPQTWIGRDIFDACLCLQTNFPPKPKCSWRTETISLQVVFRGFTRGKEQFIAQQPAQRGTGPHERTALDVWRSRACKGFGLWIFIPGRQREWCVSLWGRPLGGYQLRCSIISGWSCLEALPPSLYLSLKSSVVVLSWDCLRPMEVPLSDPDHRNEFSRCQYCGDNSRAKKWK